MVLPSKKNPHVTTVPIVKGEKNVESVFHKKKEDAIYCKPGYNRLRN